uniref:Serine/threonine-protein kinase SAPK2 isoform X1 n=1 Tax=Rhizophora mucronata TaxID=61149 RepID=A0A2P2KKS3_RHIMU
MQLEGNFLREFAMLVDSVKMRQDITSNNSYQESVTAILWYKSLANSIKCPFMLHVSDIQLK